MEKQKYVIFLSGLLALSLSACMKIKPKNEAAVESPLATEAAPGKAEASFISEGPNEYQVRFKFQSAPTTLLVEKKVHGLETSTTISVENQSWIDSKVNPGDEVHYEFKTYDLGQFHAWVSLDLKVPKDLVIDQKLDLQEKSTQDLLMLTAEDLSSTININSFARIYFTAGGILNLNGKSMQVEAAEIHSENGLIQTFTPGAKADDGRPGQSGGTVQIKALRAFGNLKIEMRGQNGGDGLAAKPADLALKGAPGAAGEPGEINNERTLDEWGQYRVGCKKVPGRGLQGHKGFQGYPGGHGQKGGDTGSATLDFSDSKDFAVLILPIVGQGGQGAIGGNGGGGGDGGPAGPMPPIPLNNIYACSPLAGAMGDSGDRGNSGEPGASGEIQSFLLNQKPIR